MTANHSKYMIDGILMDEERIKAVFKDVPVAWQALSAREKVALDMVKVIAPRGRLLDVGCYTGSFMAQVNSLYPEIDVWNVDYYQDNISIARLLYPNQSDRFSQMSVYSLEFEDASFDCVTLREVLEHLDRPVDAIREINRVLRSNGYLILTTPNANSQAYRLFFTRIKTLIKQIFKRKTTLNHLIFFDNVEWNRHIYAWTAETLYTLLLQNGFEYYTHCFYCNSFIQRMLPEMGDGLAFLVRKLKTSPNRII